LAVNTEIKPLEKNGKMWKHIERYIKNTRGPTHMLNESLVDIFEINRNDQDEYNKVSCNIDNKMLLWHGSRMVNYCSILQKGLILNPETTGAIITGKMFGNGIYTASCVSKAINYCAPSTSDGIVAILLCEVATGNQYECLKSESNITMESLKKKHYNSTRGIGKYTPSKFVEVDNVLIPKGKLIETNISGELLYDEYIVYNHHQIIMKYLVLLQID